MSAKRPSRHPYQKGSHQEYRPNGHGWGIVGGLGGQRQSYTLEDDPAATVWTGDSEPLADNLVACLREVGIASRKLSEAGHWSLLVRPEKELRAKEIVREVVEASPPE